MTRASGVGRQRVVGRIAHLATRYFVVSIREVSSDLRIAFLGGFAFFPALRAKRAELFEASQRGR